MAHHNDAATLFLFIIFIKAEVILKPEIRGESFCDINKKYIELKAVTDERICDGFYYASAFKIIKRHVENPELLDVKPTEVFEDID